MLLDHMDGRSMPGGSMALDICGQYEKRLVMTGRPTGATGSDYADYIMSTLSLDDLEQRWNAYQTRSAGS